MNRFDRITRTVNGAENSFINFLSALAPWGVPVIPAYLTYWHTQTDLSFPSWVAWTSAFVVEVLGLASMRTAIGFWEHNKRYSKDSNRAPVGLAISTYIFYLIVILTVNVILDIQNGVAWVNVLAIGLFSLLSLPAGLLIAIRAQHSELLETLMEARSSRASSRITSESVPKPSPTSGSTSRTSLANQWISKSRSRTGRIPVHKESVFEFMNSILEREGRIAEFSEVVDNLKLPDSTSSRLRNLWIDENSERLNGK